MGNFKEILKHPVNSLLSKQPHDPFAFRKAVWDLSTMSDAEFAGIVRRDASLWRVWSDVRAPLSMPFCAHELLWSCHHAVVSAGEARDIDKNRLKLDAVDHSKCWDVK